MKIDLKLVLKEIEELQNQVDQYMIEEVHSNGQPSAIYEGYSAALSHLRQWITALPEMKD